MFPNTRALIVDHRLPNRQQLCQRLEALEVQVHQESNGSRGADRALNESFDIVFMAPGLPIMKGMDVQEILRRSRVHVPIVHLGSSDRETDLASEADGLTIAEPVEQGALESLLSRVLPHQKVDSLVPVMCENVRAIQEALDSDDFELVVSLAQRLRELNSSLSSLELAAAIDRLEVCLADDEFVDLQVGKIQSTLNELTTLVQKRRLDRHRDTTRKKPTT